MQTVRTVLSLILRILALFMLYQVAIRIARRLFHFPAPAFIGRFLDSNYRRRMQPPATIVERSGIEPGMVVLEIGCGSGAYTTYVARAVSPEGEVCALDIQPAMLRLLEEKLARPENQDLHNVTLHESSAYELPFEDGTFDVVYTITVLQEIPDRHRALVEARRVLKPGGKLAVTEWLPDPDFPLISTTEKQGLAAGFEVDASVGNLWTYTVRFRKGD